MCDETITEVQKEAWGKVVDRLLNKTWNGMIPVYLVVGTICMDMNVSPCDYHKTELQIQRFLRESRDFLIVPGKIGGVRKASIEEERKMSREQIQAAITAKESAALADNYTCACGNGKLNTLTDRSCWRCGNPLVK